MAYILAPKRKQHILKCVWQGRGSSGREFKLGPVVQGLRVAITGEITVLP